MQLFPSKMFNIKLLMVYFCSNVEVFFKYIEYTVKKSSKELKLKLIHTFLTWICEPSSSHFILIIYLNFISNRVIRVSPKSNITVSSMMTSNCSAQTPVEVLSGVAVSRWQFSPKYLPQIMVFRTSINGVDYTKWSF